MIDRPLAALIAVAVGALIALQAPLNSQLGRAVGGLAATLVAFVVGLLAVLAATAAAGQLAGVARVGAAPWWVIAGGGLMSAIYVSSIVWTVRALGAGGLTAATVAGQLACAVAVDHFGWLGVGRDPVTASRLAGVALLAVGTYLVIRD